MCSIFVKILFKIQEKAIMNQEAADRTPAQRAQLCTIFEKLDCLARFPPEVREELASCARYQYLGPGRMVLREGHEAHAVYFVLNGEITVSRLWWDPVGGFWVFKGSFINYVIYVFFFKP